MDLGETDRGDNQQNRKLEVVDWERLQNNMNNILVKMTHTYIYIEKYLKELL